MASVIDQVARDALPQSLEPGAVVPIEHHPSTARGLWPLGAGGSLYLVTRDAHRRHWLVAVLEAPERSGLEAGDERPPGWYAPANVIPVTEITGLRVGKLPHALTAAEERQLRALFDDVDAPVVEVAAQRTFPEVDARRDPAVFDRPPLVRAGALLAEGAIAPAIDALLEAWRASRAVEVADAIDRATLLLPGWDRPLYIDRFDDDTVTTTWNALFADQGADAMPQLLRNVRVSQLAASTEQRFERLAMLPDDPRVSRRIGELALHGAPCLSLVERGREARTWETFAMIGREINLYERRSIISLDMTLASSGLLAFLTELPPWSPGEADQAALAAVGRELDRLAAADRTEHELVDAIAADWESDEPRLIYADWLMEHGHPRGEYLSLVLQREAKLTPARRRRLALLSDVPYKYGVLDDLATTLYRPRSRGLDRSLDVYWNTPPLLWMAAGHHPLVRLLTSIRLVGLPLVNRADAIAGFVAMAPNLVRIDEVDATCARELLPRLGGTWRHVRDALVRS